MQKFFAIIILIFLFLSLITNYLSTAHDLPVGKKDVDFLVEVNGDNKDDSLSALYPPLCPPNLGPLFPYPYYPYLPRRYPPKYPLFF